MNKQLKPNDLRGSLLESAKNGAAERNLFMPLCYYDYFESLAGYSSLRREVTEDDGGHPACEELAYRLEFYGKMGAVFLDWIATQAYTIETDKSVRFEETKVGRETVSTYDTPVGSLREVSREFPEQKTAFITEQLLKSERDADIYRYIIEAQTPIATPKEAGRWLEMIGSAGIACHTAGGVPYHSLIHLYGPETFLTMDIADSSAITSLLKTIHRQNLEIAEILAGSPAAVVKHEASWDIGVISPDLMQEHYVPYLREYSDILHSAGKLSMDHVSGQNIMPFLRQFEDCGIDLLYGVEIGPENAETLSELSEEWRGCILMCLGFSPVKIWADSEQTLVSECETVRAAFAGRPVLFGTADAMAPGTDPNKLALVKKTLTD